MSKAFVTGCKAFVIENTDDKTWQEAMKKIEQDIRAAGIKKEEIISVTRTVNSYGFTEIVILYEKEA